ncbi:nitroreductase/quinone reductase family protein [Amycolatopsis orientalis]|uniref:nitroreductase/quinone reductase family protein n=1 Tax=Amycolatopsis orientalis TaxID=31958 RepID=UPI00039F4760|nr:nitroreductase/quinone reductase family protein [Amycolatopsis orientalis]
MSNDFQRRLIAEFRANGGALGGRFEGWPLAVLTTTGARTGRSREVILGFLEIDGNGVVVASANGADRNPAWYHNIRRNPRVTVETGDETYPAMAAIPRGAEYEKLFARVVAEAPGYGEYQARATREIPVVVLHRIDKRGKGMGDWLVEVHQWFRDELRALRDQADRLADGSATALVWPKPDLAQEMRAHCLGFCAALRRHHTGEDSAVFPALAGQFPALAPVLQQLSGQHQEVARLQESIRELVDGFVPGESDPVRLRTELERLASELEAHFAFEEQAVVTALNATAAAPPTA